MKIVGPKRNKVEYWVYDKSGNLTRIIEATSEKEAISEVDWLKGVSCFVINENGEVLIEKRVGKGLTPGEFDLCSGHIDNKETPTQAMIRELQEELSIPFEKAIELSAISKDNSIPLKFKNHDGNRNFFIYFFCLKLSANTKIEFQKEEIVDIRWIELENVFQLIREGKTKFPGSYTIYEKIFQKVEEFVSGKNINGNIRN